VVLADQVTRRETSSASLRARTAGLDADMTHGNAAAEPQLLAGILRDVFRPFRARVRSQYRAGPTPSGCLALPVAFVAYNHFQRSELQSITLTEP
jgi:hypothetical protein